MYIIIRGDDNGNIFIVGYGMDKLVAERVFDALVTKAHKQWYQILSYNTEDERQGLIKEMGLIWDGDL